MNVHPTLIATVIITLTLHASAALACGNSIFHRNPNLNVPSKKSAISYFEQGYYVTAIHHAFWQRYALTKGSRAYKKLIKRQAQEQLLDVVALKIAAASTIRATGQTVLHTYGDKHMEKDGLSPRRRIRWATAVLKEFNRVHPKNIEYQNYLAEALALKTSTRKKAYMIFKALEDKDLLLDHYSDLAIAKLHKHYKHPKLMAAAITRCEKRAPDKKMCALDFKPSWLHLNYRRPINKASRIDIFSN